MRMHFKGENPRFLSQELVFYSQFFLHGNAHCTLGYQSLNFPDLQGLYLFNGFANHSGRCYENSLERCNRELYLHERRFRKVIEVAGLWVRRPEI